jgi:NTP pyrophosphatase (non-canonical NTP hydrolase)
MEFNEYQKETRKTAIYPGLGNNFSFPTIGLAGESGEVAEKIKKIIRDRGGIVDEYSRNEVKKELGDVLWYVAQLATELNIELDDVVKFNLEKITSRKERNVVHGEGDNR